MVGDWLHWLPLYAKGKYYPFQIKPTDFVSDLVVNFAPIPLTTEILEKNGFRFFKAAGEIHPYYYLPHKFSMKCAVNGDKHFYLDCIGADIRIYNVHELQHILRLCGLNELADNFIVE